MYSREAESLEEKSTQDRKASRETPNVEEIGDWDKHRSRRDRTLVRLFGPRLVCGSLETALALDISDDVEARYEGDLTSFDIGLPTALAVLILVCCNEDLDPLFSCFETLAGTPTIALSNIVLVCSGKAFATLKSSRPQTKVHAWLQLESSIEDLKKAIALASQGILGASSEDNKSNFDVTRVRKRDTAGVSTGGRSLQKKYQHLSLREENTARLAAEGFSNEEIAEHLSVTVATVKSHLQNTFRKTEFKRRSQLVRLFTAGVTSTTGIKTEP